MHDIFKLDLVELGLVDLDLVEFSPDIYVREKLIIKVNRAVV